MDRQKSVPYHPFGIDRDDRIGPNQAMQRLVDLHLDAKMTARRTRYVDLRHLAGIHACNLHLRTLSYAIEIGKFGIQQHVARESFMAAPDEEYPESEQGHAGDDEDPYSKISSSHCFTP